MPDPLPGRGHRIEQGGVDAGDRGRRLERPLGDLLEVERGGELAHEPGRLALRQLPHRLLERLGGLPHGRFHARVGPRPGADQRPQRRRGRQRRHDERSDEDQRDRGQS